MSSTYTPVAYVYREIIEEEIAKGTEGKIFFFDDDGKVNSFEGKISAMKELPGDGIYIFMQPENKLRIDRIITLYGKPGAAFDEYDSFGNQCLSCTGGYDL